MKNYFVYLGEEEEAVLGLSLEQAKDIALSRISFLLENGYDYEAREVFIGKKTHECHLIEFKEESFLGETALCLEPVLKEV